MAVLLKFTLKSIAEKKFRTFLILLSISLSVALSLSSFAMRDIIKNSIMTSVMSFFGSADVMVVPDENSLGNPKLKNLGEANKYFSNYGGQLNYTAKMLGLDDSVKSEVGLRGISLKDALAFGQLSLKEDLGLEFQGKKIYISEFTAKQHNLKLGQYIELEFESGKKKFKITGIGYNTGALTSQNDSMQMIIPAQTLSTILGYRGQYMMILFQTAEGVDKDEAIKALEKIYTRDKVSETVPWQEIDTALNQIIIPFIFMLILVLATSVFIIYTAFKVITKEKLPVLGTFRSIGATKRSVDFILLLESFFYGLIGAGVGIMLGRLILFGIAYGMVNSLGAPGKVDTIVQIDFGYYLLSIVFGILLSIISSAMPILAVSKLSVRDIVLGFNQQYKEMSLLKVIVYSILLAIALFLPYYEPLNKNVVFDLLSVVFLCVSLVALVPIMVRILLWPLTRLAKLFFGNLGNIAAKNLNENRSVLNNISLLTLGIASILLINTLSNTILVEVAKAYEKVDYQLELSTDVTRNKINAIKAMPEVTAVLPGLTQRAEVPDSDVERIFIQGTNSDYPDYWRENFESPFPEWRDYLNQGRYLVITNTVANKLNLSYGDKVKLKYGEKKENTMEYTIIATFDTTRYNGFYALTNAKNLLKDSPAESYQELWIKTAYPKKVQQILLDKYAGDEYFGVKTIEEYKAESAQGNAVIIGIFSSFSIIAMAIGSIGILNNFLVSLMARQKSIAVMKSVGMSRGQTFRMLSLEAIISGTIGGMTGMIGGILLTQQVAQFLKLIEFSFRIKLNLAVLLSGLLLSIVISLISTILPARKVARQNIVAAIKYE